jgi:hypothetical protein
MSHYDRLVLTIRYVRRGLYDAIRLCLSSCFTVTRSFARKPLSV